MPNSFERKVLRVVFGAVFIGENTVLYSTLREAQKKCGKAKLKRINIAWRTAAINTHYDHC